ncbi:PspC domain-containing protein [Demetria terragena]|uniref:PspC domain-containing protein n=1 Tax=Demetria terragena TaxID=63959 RepID=UPI00036CB5DA|nr:PspC domain-containing protein [Demetria terragena]
MNTSVPPSAPGEAPGAAPPPPQPDGLDRFFAGLRGLGLHRSDNERWVGGVCGGVAERLRVDPLIVRAAFILLGLVFGAGITVYLIAWVLLPDRSGTIQLERALRGGDGTAIVLVVIAAIIAFSGFGLFWGWGGPGPVIPILLVIGAVIYFVGKQNRSATQPPDATYSVAAPPTQHSATPAAPGMSGQPPVGPGQPPVWGAGSPPPPAVPPVAPLPPVAPRPRRRRLGAGPTLILFGIAAILGSSIALIAANTDLSEVSARLGLAAATITLGVGVLAAGFMGRKAGFAAFIGLVLAVVTAMSAVLPRELSLNGPHGTQEWSPAKVTSSSTYTMGVGEGELDLRGLTPPTASTLIKSRVSVGELRIIVPEDLPIRITAHVDGGEIRTERPADLTVPSATESDGGIVTDISADTAISGMGRSRTFTYGEGSPALTLDADVGFGQITIERTPS